MREIEQFLDPVDDLPLDIDGTMITAAKV